MNEGIAVFVFVIGLLIGGSLGFLACCVCVAASRDDELLP
jgi:hypothetical protein